MQYFSANSFLTMGLIFILVVSLVFNGVLFYIAKKYYTRAKLAEVFPNHQNYYQKANTKLPKKTQKRIVLFGNSRTEMWKNLPDLEKLEFVNRGIGGETTTQNRARFQQDVLALEPDIVILQTGMNDLTLLGVQTQLYKEVVQQCQDNLRFFVKLLQAQQIEIIFLTIISPSQPELARSLVWNEKIFHAVEEVNQYWLNLPHTKQLHIIDTTKVLKNVQGQWHKGVNLDTLHLTPLGYDYLNQAITLVLKKTY